MRHYLVAGLAIAAVSAALPAAAQTVRDLQERYCTGDAFRLCSSEIPNEERIELCMAQRRHLLSPECRAVFDDPASAKPVARAKPRKPMALAPE